MMLLACTVYDTKAEAFLPPFFCANEALARRSFADACSDPKHPFFKHAEEYILYCIGSFDDQVGVLVVGIPQSLGVGSAFKDPIYNVVPGGS